MKYELTHKGDIHQREGRWEDIVNLSKSKKLLIYLPDAAEIFSRSVVGILTREKQFTCGNVVGIVFLEEAKIWQR